MLQKIVLSVALLFFGLTGVSAQVIVEARPVTPQLKQQLEPPKDDNFFLVPAEWAVKDGVYYYVQPRYVKRRPGMKHVPGKWKKVKGGWTWKQAEWKTS